MGQARPEYQQAVMGGLGVGAQYGVLLPFSRKHESEADQLGQELMAEAGFDPAEAVEVWKKMDRLSQEQPPEFMSTHPSHGTRIRDLEQNLRKTNRMYRAAQEVRNPQCAGS